MRKTIHTLAVVMLAALAACGGSDEGDVKDLPGVDASGTADTEIFTQDPDTTGVPTAAQGGTLADSVVPGSPGASVQNQNDVGQTQGTTPP